jgi:hypothetical protein
MFIDPKDEWIVVVRKLRGESHLKGRILKGGLTEAQARAYAKNHGPVGHNAWAMKREYY